MFVRPRIPVSKHGKVRPCECSECAQARAYAAGAQRARELEDCLGQFLACSNQLEGRDMPYPIAKMLSAAHIKATALLAQRPAKGGDRG